MQKQSTANFGSAASNLLQKIVNFMRTQHNTPQTGVVHSAMASRQVRASIAMKSSFITYHNEKTVLNRYNNDGIHHDYCLGPVRHSVKFLCKVSKMCKRNTKASLSLKSLHKLQNTLIDVALADYALVHFIQSSFPLCQATEFLQ